VAYENSGVASQLFTILFLTIDVNRRFQLICSEICLYRTVTAAAHMLPKSFPKSTPLSPHSYLAKKKVHPLKNSGVKA
jgi:hypothetical protein